jgi:hypothetical protein
VHHLGKFEAAVVEERCSAGATVVGGGKERGTRDVNIHKQRYWTRAKLKNGTRRRAR